jgi:hypothetical protein
MAFTASKMFRQFMGDVMANAVAFDLSGTPDTFKAALYNNTGTPDQNANTTLSTYNGAASAWVVANEVVDATNWVAGGRPLVTPLIDIGTSGVVFFDAADTAGGGNVTLSGVMGCLVYDTTVSNQGVCYNYFGGAQSVTAGTFTIVWSANGIFRITL